LKRLSIILSVALVMLALPATVSADHGDYCNDSTPQNFHSTAWSGGTDHTKTGVRATIHYKPLHTCIDTNGWDLVDGHQVWVALTDNLIGGTGILQLGIIRCHSGNPVCDGNPHYFWASGGCLAPPYPSDLGPVDQSSLYGYTFQITLGSDNIYYLSIKENGSIGPPLHLVSISRYDSRISCWINSRADSNVSCESNDRGDACGYKSFDHLRVRDWQHQNSQGQPWYSAQSTGCQTNNPAGGTTRYCLLQGSTGIDFWSVP
jgi:hypothetical protein